jgi:hypothetical protein
MAITLHNTKQIDIAGGTSDHTIYTLGLLDNLPWQDGKDEEHLKLLQDKINHYLHYIEEGQIYELFPEAKGAKFRIEVLSQFPPVSQWGLDFLDRAKVIIKNLGFTLSHTDNIEDYKKSLENSSNASSKNFDAI